MNMARTFWMETHQGDEVEITFRNDDYEFMEGRMVIIEYNLLEERVLLNWSGVMIEVKMANIHSFGVVKRDYGVEV